MGEVVGVRRRGRRAARAIRFTVLGVVMLLGLGGLFILGWLQTSTIRNPNGTPMTDPAIELVSDAGDFVNGPTVNAAGQVLAFNSVDNGRNETVITLLDAVTGEVIERHPIEMPPCFTNPPAWDDDGDRVSVETYNGQLGPCIGTLTAEAPGWDFVEAPGGGIEDPQRTDLPRGAGTGLASLDGKLLAISVCERLVGIYNPDCLTDTRLLDAEGNFVSQLGDMAPMGWAADGSLIVWRDADLYRVMATAFEGMSGAP